MSGPSADMPSPVRPCARPRAPRRRGGRQGGAVEMQMGPMIDMVFLLLVFFMVTARPKREESDISLGLPGALAQAEALDIPDEVRVVIGPRGGVSVNELELAPPGDGALDRLVDMLRRFRAAADAARSDALVTIDPHDAVVHQRVVDVLNACARAGIDGVTFAGGSGASSGEGGAP